jgi:hypothetical protein
VRKHLWILDVCLLGLVVLTGSLLWDRWQNMQAREQALLRQMIPPGPAPVVPPLPRVSPSVASAYIEVAQKFLFSKDRSSEVILDPPAPPPPPPPPKPMPTLPLAYGVMDLGSGPLIILSERSGAQHHAYRPGERIGEFTLAAINGQEIVFEWDGKQVKKRLEDLIDKKAAESTQPAEKAPAAAAASAPAPGVTKVASAEAGPGMELGATSRACIPGDTSPAGTVKDGFRKVVTKTPFGDSCRWEATK